MSKHLLKRRGGGGGGGPAKNAVPPLMVLWHFAIPKNKTKEMLHRAQGHKCQWITIQCTNLYWNRWVDPSLVVPHLNSYTAYTSLSGGCGGTKFNQLNRQQLKKLISHSVTKWTLNKTAMTPPSKYCGTIKGKIYYLGFLFIQILKHICQSKSA